MRLFTLFVSAVFVAEGIWLIGSGEPFGWLLAGDVPPENDGSSELE